MSNINTKIRQRISSDKLSVQTKLPSNSEGRDGDLRLTTVKGVNILFGKISGKWYNFGHGKTIGYRSKAALKEKVTDDHIRQLNLDNDLYMKKAKFSVSNIDYLTIDSKVFDVASSNTVSKIYIGDISLQPTWGTTGSTIKLENVEGHGKDLKLLGGGTTGINKDGGDTILSSGLKTGSGDSGSITLGAGDSGTSAATALNVNATSTVLSGTLTINTINTDTAGDNYLVEVSGVVKKRTPAEVLSDIGAQAAGSYITGSGSLSAQDLTDIGNLSGTNTGDQIIPNNYLRDNEDDTTSGTITAAGFTTTGTWTFDDATSGTVGITTVHTGSSFTDNDTSLMTAGAIKEKIEAYGYSTTSGDITGVTITTDSGGGSAASDTGGSADFSILGSSGVGVTNSGTTITAVAVPAEIDHDSLNNWSANKHIDWTASSAGTIHASNYTDTNTNQLTTFTVSATTDSNATTISQGDDLMFAAGTGITCETTADGTVTITNTVSDTNTQLSTEEVQDIVGDMFASNTETRIAATYVDGGVGAGKINLVVDDMTADTNTNQLTTFDVDADSGTAETIAHGNTLQLTGGTGISTTVSSTDTVTFALSSGAALSNLGGGSGTTFLKKDGTWATPTDTDTNTNQLTTFNIGVDTNTNATTIAHGETLTFTGGTGISTETTADGTITFTNTVTDTNTNQLTTFSLTGDSGTPETISQGSTLDIAGGTGIDTAVGSTDTVTVSLASGSALSNLGGGSGSTFLKKDGTWATPTDTDTNTNQLTTFTLTADSGSNQTIEHGNTLDIAGSSPIVTAVGATDTVTVSLDDPINLSELNESTDATDDKILLWDESGSAWKYMTLDNLQDSIDTTGGGGGGGSNYVTDDADDTMEGTLTIDKNSTATTTSTVLGLDIDLDQTGIVAGGNTLAIYGVRINVNDDAPTHVQGHYPVGIENNVTSNKTGQSFTMGLYNICKGGDTDYGIINNVGENGDSTTGSIGISQTVTNDGTDYMQKSSADTGDYFSMKTIANGETTLATVDDDGTKLANLHMEIQGFVEFDGCGVGFDLVTPTYDATDTDVDFKTGNKQMVTLTGNITDLNLYFPSTSGNFTLLVKQDGSGSRAITNYKAFHITGTAAGSSTVLFPGGANPTLTTTASKVDIISFFWDTDNEIAYGVATVNF